MKKSRNYSKTLLFIAIISSVSEAKDFSGHIAASVGESDNAGKTSTDPISEKQESYEIGLSGDYDNTYLSASVDYTGTDNRFAEKSQRDQQYLEGKSMLQLGSLTDPVDVQFNHSRKTLLSSPDEINITNNQDEREMLSATPRIKKRISDADLLVGSVEVADINFIESDINDSERQTAILAWTRSSSKVSQFNVQLQRADVKFPNSEDANYTYTAAVATYTTELRKLQYTLALGYNRSERETQESFGKPTYALSITYNSGLNSLQLMGSQAITDSSYGGGNLPSVNQSPTSDGVFKVDQIQRRNAELTWTNKFLCNKCTMNVSIHHSNDDYVVLPDEIRQQGGRVDLTYDFSAQSSLSLGYGVSENKFIGSLAGEDYELDSASIQYRYFFNSGISFRLFAEEEKRESDGSVKVYDETFVGVSLGYYF